MYLNGLRFDSSVVRDYEKFEKVESEFKINQLLVECKLFAHIKTHYLNVFMWSVSNDFWISSL